MQLALNAEEVRVLGALVEKSLTTPEYYPLSLNALKNACNQKSSRDPVVEYDEGTVARALEGLRDKHLVWFVDSADSRVQKYRHRVAEALDLSPEELGAMAVLMLRGPQTAGEIRGHGGRMHEFASVDAVEAVLEGLAAREEMPLAVKLPRQPGRKEHRYAHALCGVPVGPAEEVAASRPEPGAIREARAERERLAALEAELATLRAEMAAMRELFEGFRKRFE